MSVGGAKWLGSAGCPLSELLACYWLPGGPGVSTRSVRCSERCRNNITGISDALVGEVLRLVGEID